MADMNVQIVRLISGEEILCDYKDSSESTANRHVLTKPLILVQEPNGSMGFMQWMPYTEAYDKGVEVADSFVGFVTPPSPEVVAQYKSHITGIITPPDKPVLSLVT